MAFTSPAFSPDGSKIAVAYWQGDHWDIQVMPAPGTQAQMNTDGSNQHPLFPAGALGGLTLQYHNDRERHTHNCYFPSRASDCAGKPPLMAHAELLQPRCPYQPE